MRYSFALLVSAGLASTASAQVQMFAGPSPNIAGPAVDFDNPFIPSGPVPANVYTGTGITSVTQIGTLWTTAGDVVSTGLHNGQVLVSQGGVPAIAGNLEPLDNPGPGDGWDIVLDNPADEFQCGFPDQSGMSLDVELFLGATSLGTGTFNAVTTPNLQYWRDGGGSQFDRIVILSTSGAGGYGIDDLGFGNGPPPTPPANDECINAVVVGLGSTPYSNVNATDSIPVWACATGGSDVWFQFTATSDGFVVFDTFGSGYDTAIEVFQGDCANLVAVDCNDDLCSLQSSVTVPNVTMGTLFTVRVGGWNGSQGTGTLNITEVAPLPPPVGSIPSWLSAVNTGVAPSYVNSTIAGPIEDDIGPTNGANGVTYEFIVHGDNGGCSSGLMGALNTGVGDQGALKFEQWSDTLKYGVTEFGVADHSYAGANTPNMDIHLVFVADPVGGTTELFENGVSQGLANYAPVLAGIQGIGQIHNGNGGTIDVMSLGLVRGAAVYEGQLGLAEIQAHRDAYFSSIGVNYCGPAVPNSAGTPGQITASGSAIAADNNVTLVASDLPQNQFGYFLNSMTQANTFPVPNSQGVLCVGGGIGRYNLPGAIFNTGNAGEGSLVLDLTMTPVPNSPFIVSIQAGETWNFTCWYRDNNPGSTSNFTDGVQVSFQ